MRKHKRQCQSLPKNYKFIPAEIKKSELGNRADHMRRTINESRNQELFMLIFCEIQNVIFTQSLLITEYFSYFKI